MKQIRLIGIIAILISIYINILLWILTFKPTQVEVYQVVFPAATLSLSLYCLWRRLALLKPIGALILQFSAIQALNSIEATKIPFILCQASAFFLVFSSLLPLNARSNES